MCEKITCDHCYEKVEIDKIVDLQERIGADEFHGDKNLCEDCYNTLENELSGPPDMYGDETEEEFWDHEDEDGPFGPRD